MASPGGQLSKGQGRHQTPAKGKGIPMASGPAEQLLPVGTVHSVLDDHRGHWTGRSCSSLVEQMREAQPVGVRAPPARCRGRAVRPEDGRFQAGLSDSVRPCLKVGDVKGGAVTRGSTPGSVPKPDKQGGRHWAGRWALRISGPGGQASGSRSSLGAAGSFSLWPTEGGAAGAGGQAAPRRRSQHHPGPFPLLDPPSQVSRPGARCECCPAFLMPPVPSHHTHG